MKEISKIKWVIVLLLTVTCLHAQTWSISNTVGAVEKGVANGMLIKELDQITDQAELVKALHEVETDYNKRRKTSANFKSLPMMVATIGAIEFTNKSIEELEEKLDVMFEEKENPFRYQRRALHRQLANEKKYLKEIRSEYGFLVAAIPLSGGPGYNYTTFLKILIRTLKIRSKVLSMDHDVEKRIRSARNLIKQ